MRKLIKLREHRELAGFAAEWFHQKWGIPLEAYTESIDSCISCKSAVPQWYLAMEEDTIVGGLGVIENDFHDRKDLRRMYAPYMLKKSIAARESPGNCWSLSVKI